MRLKFFKLLATKNHKTIFIKVCLWYLIKIWVLGCVHVTYKNFQNFTHFVPNSMDFASNSVPESDRLSFILKNVIDEETVSPNSENFLSQNRAKVGRCRNDWSLDVNGQLPTTNNNNYKFPNVEFQGLLKNILRLCM